MSKIQLSDLGRVELMERISVERIKPGMELAKDLYSFDGQLLLARGTIVSVSHLERLARQGITQVYILGSSGRTSKRSENFNEIYQQSLDTVKSFMLETKLGKPLPSDEVVGLVNTLIDQVFDEINVFDQLRLMRNKDEYLFTHSVNVSILAVLVARWLKCDESLIKMVGLAGILHDIGKIFISPRILTKPSSLTDEEFAEMKKHTTLGHELISQYDWIQPEVTNAVLMHHERLDGSGYPLGANDESIGFLARIVAVADVYDAITSTRVYSLKETPFKAAEILWEESFGKLDPKITRIFCDRAADFYVGQKVILSNGAEGKIIFIDRNYPTRPLVQVNDRFYNLNLDRSVTIEEIID